MRVTVGAGLYSALATLVPPCIVAGTFAVPATPAGVVVAFAITTLVAAVAPTVRDRAGKPIDVALPQAAAQEAIGGATVRF